VVFFPPSVSVTFPLDITKTRLQIQGQFVTGRLPYRGMLKTAFGIGRPGYNQHSMLLEDISKVFPKITSS